MQVVQLRNFFLQHKFIRFIAIVAPHPHHISHLPVVNSKNSMNSNAIACLESLNYKSQLILIMSGIPGSGKSTFSQKILNSVNSNGNGWVVLNQDVLQTRKRVESEAHRFLEAGFSVIIDRCNFDGSQRQHWVELAYQYNVNAILCIVLPHSQDVSFCSARAYMRGDDGIHSSDTNWKAVCSNMKNQFRFPVLEEGFSGIFHCRSDEDADSVLGAVVAMSNREC